MPEAGISAMMHIERPAAEASATLATMKACAENLGSLRLPLRRLQVHQVRDAEPRHQVLPLSFAGFLDSDVRPGLSRASFGLEIRG